MLLISGQNVNWHSLRCPVSKYLTVHLRMKWPLVLWVHTSNRYWLRSSRVLAYNYMYMYNIYFALSFRRITLAFMVLDCVDLYVHMFVFSSNIVTLCRKCTISGQFDPHLDKHISWLNWERSFLNPLLSHFKDNIESPSYISIFHRKWNARCFLFHKFHSCSFLL